MGIFSKEICFPAPAGLSAPAALLGVLLFAASSGSGQAPPTPAAQASQSPATTLLVPPAPLLPDTLGKLTRAAARDTGDGLAGVDPNESRLLAEDGLKRFARSDYAQGAEHGTVTVYQFGDASGAYSAFTSFRRPDMRPVTKLGDDAVEASGELLFRSGINLVRADLHTSSEQAQKWMQELIGTLPKANGASALPPLLPTFLPAKGLAPDSLKYALGPVGYQQMGGVLPPDIIEFNKSGEAVTAKYAGRGTVTLLLFPTPQIAGEDGRKIVTEMNREGETAGTVKLRREGPLLVMTTGKWTADQAQQMVDSIHLHDQLSWNKDMPPQFHTEVRKTYSLLSSIAALSGVLMLAAVILGLFFGGGRALVRILQGKPAATEPEFLRIDLRDKPGESGSFKPLH